MDNLFNVIGKLLVGILMDFFTSLLLKFYWLWFIIPIFPVKEISVLQAFGFILVVSLFTMKVTNSKNEPEFSSVMIGKFIYIIIFFVIGFLLSLLL